MKKIYILSFLIPLIFAQKLSDTCSSKPVCEKLPLKQKVTDPDVFSFTMPS